MSYLPRFLTAEIKRLLDSFPCVFINGPRQAGKTTIAQMVWGSDEAVYVNFDDISTLAVASQAPESFLSAYKNKLILDEIQLIPELYRPLKVSIDEKRWEAQGGLVAGVYILTGSTNILALPQLSDALVGRMIVKTLYPLSAAEIHQGKGDFITRLQQGQFQPGRVAEYDLLTTIQQATYPEIYQLNDTIHNDWFRSYVATLIQRDVQHIMNIEKTTLLPQLLRLLATRIGGMVNEADLARSLKENAPLTKRYRIILELLFLTMSVPPWFRNIGKRLVKSPKSYLIDTNLACFLLGLRLQDVLEKDPNLFGHLLENFVATELLKQLQEPIHQAGLYHFRTIDGREVDFVIEFPNQTCVGIEVKASDSVSLDNCKGLLELQNMTNKDFLMGCILYRGRQILKLHEKIWALPISVLWQ